MLFGEFLLERGAVESTGLLAALDEQQRRKPFLGSVAVAEGALSVPDVLGVLSRDRSSEIDDAPCAFQVVQRPRTRRHVSRELDQVAGTQDVGHRTADACDVGGATQLPGHEASHLIRGPFAEVGTVAITQVGLQRVREADVELAMPALVE